MRSNSNNNDSDSWSNDGSSMHRVKKASAWSIPFAFAITLEIFFSCIAITAALLIVSTANTSTSNNICVEQGIDSIQQLSDSIQQRIADIVTITLNDTVAGPMLAIKETARIHSLNFVDPANYDRLWPHFYQQIKGYDAVSLIYYGDATTKDFVGVRVVSQTPASTQYGVDLMDETSSRCPQTCPSAMTSDTRPGIRFKYNLDDSGSISGAPYDSASFDPTGRTWFTLATSRPSSVAVWTPVYPFSNRIDVGITAAIQIYSRNDSSRPIGVLASDMSFGILKTQLGLLPLTKSGFAIVFDDNGNLFGSSVSSENVTVINSDSTASIKSIQNLIDPVSKEAMNYVLSTIKNDITQLPRNTTTYRVPQPGGPNRDLRLLLKAVDMGNGLNIFLLIGAPLSDYTGGIDATSVELKDRLKLNTRNMLIIGAGVVLAFVLLSIPMTYYTIASPLKRLAKNMEEVTRFDFGSLKGEDRNKRSFIRELGVMQTAYWGMIIKFSKGIQDNRRLVQGGFATKSITSLDAGAAGQQYVYGTSGTPKSKRYDEW